MSLKDTLRKYTPQFLLDWNRNRKKEKVNAALEKKKSTGDVITKEDLIKDLRSIGIVSGDILLVHSSLSKIGYLKDGPKTLVDALLEVIGPEGNLLMPTSPNNIYQLNYIRNTPYFDVNNSPSKTGAITEYFRKLPNVLRSWHPTEPVSAFGPQASYFIEEHFNQLTPYNTFSPFYKVSKSKGKLLYIGVTLDNAGTNLHTLEDAVDFKFPVYYPEIFEIDLIDPSGKKHRVKTKVHDPAWSKQRKCDELIPLFVQKGIMQKVRIGEANVLLADAEGFLNTMVDEYNRHGVTMYTPKGS